MARCRKLAGTCKHRCGRVQNSGLWLVLPLETSGGKTAKLAMCQLLQKMKADEKNEDAPASADLKELKEKAVKEFSDLRNSFREVKFLTLTASAPDAKTMKLEARMEFPSDGDAKKIEKILNTEKALKFLANITRDKHKGFMASFGPDMHADLEKSLKVQVDGVTLVVTATLTEETFKKLAEKVEEREKIEKESKRTEF